MAVPDENAAVVALHELRVVIAVWRYINDPRVTSRMVSAYRGVQSRWSQFQQVVKDSRGTNIHPVTLWREFMTNFMGRMVSWTGNWVHRHLNELETLWTRVLHSATDPDTQRFANSVIGAILAMRVEMEQVVQFDPSVFTFM